MKKVKNKAVVLLSGGMDSAVTLYAAAQENDCTALIFDYGQKSSKETGCAKEISKALGINAFLLDISLPWKGSALIDDLREVPRASTIAGAGIPDTYVPGRNIIFLSYGVSCAEAIGADAVFIGAHQLDFSNYPDCRSEFFDHFRETVGVGTKTGADGNSIKIVTPIIDLKKSEIILKGAELGVPFEKTWSCYRNGEEPCMECESCLLRAKGFAEAGVPDPLVV